MLDLPACPIMHRNGDPFIDEGYLRRCWATLTLDDLANQGYTVTSIVFAHGVKDRQCSDAVSIHDPVGLCKYHRDAMLPEDAE